MKHKRRYFEAFETGGDRHNKIMLDWTSHFYYLEVWGDDVPAGSEETSTHRPQHILPHQYMRLDVVASDCFVAIDSDELRMCERTRYEDVPPIMADHKYQKTAACPTGSIGDGQDCHVFIGPYDDSLFWVLPGPGRPWLGM